MKAFLMICASIFIFGSTLAQNDYLQFVSLSKLPDNLDSTIYVKIKKTTWAERKLLKFDSSWSIDISPKTTKNYKLNFVLLGDSVIGKISIKVVSPEYFAYTEKFHFKETSLPCVCKNHSKHECECDDKKCKERLEKEEGCIGWKYDSK